MAPSNVPLSSLPIPSTHHLLIADTSPTTDSSNGTMIILVPPPTGWASFSSAQRGGIIAACVVSILGLLSVTIGVCWLQRKRKKLSAARGRRASTPRPQDASRRSSRSRIRQLAEQAGARKAKEEKAKQRAKRPFGGLGSDEGIELREMGRGRGGNRAQGGGKGKEREHVFGEEYDFSGLEEENERGFGREDSEGWVRVAGEPSQYR